MAETRTTLSGHPVTVPPEAETAGREGEASVTQRLSGVAAGELVARRQRSLWGDAWRRLLRNKLSVVGLVIVTAFTFVALCAPLLAPYSQSEVVDFRLARYPPSWTWPMGLDQNGRDIFSRLVYGARVSLVVAVLSQALILVIGLPIGAISGFFSGRVDNFIMRSVDVIYAIPQILLVMVLLNVLGPGLVNIFIAIGVIGWVTLARLVRGQFLALREQEYVNASRVAGAGHWSIIVKHLLPNSLTPVIVALTFGIPTAIFTEAALSYVGVGILPPQASWGQMVGEAGQPGLIMADPHMLLFPVVAIGLTMLGFTFLGDGLRDALDVRGNE
jgi:ABC-type dipeptide/oligopeptide/nickel transport system permease subunit